MKLWFAGIHSTWLAVAVLLAISPKIGAQSTYTTTDLGILGGTYFTAYSINKSGQVAGYFAAPDARYHTFLYTDAR